MTAAGFPWMFVAAWFIWALPNPLPWKQALVAARFAAPTSAGVLFCMLEAAGLKETWLFQKARILAIFDDLDTILFMVPLKAILIGLKWELFVILAVVFGLLIFGYKKLHVYQLPNGWRSTMIYAFVITAITELLYYLTKYHIAMEAIHIEVLLPAFILGVVIETKEHGDSSDELDHNAAHQDEKAQTCVSAIFMVLVGLSMPPLFSDQEEGASMDAGTFIGHVIAVSILMVLGKMFPVACYQKEATLCTRFALAVGMCPRGEVGAGVLLISLDLGIKGEAVGVAIVCLALNMIMTGGFIYTVKSLVTEWSEESQSLVRRVSRRISHLWGNTKSNQIPVVEVKVKPVVAMSDQY
jgi:Kef-type K+ transport system membrane component KefB